MLSRVFAGKFHTVPLTSPSLFNYFHYLHEKQSNILKRTEYVPVIHTKFRVVSMTPISTSRKTPVCPILYDISTAKLK